MPIYELSVEAEHVREAEEVVSLKGREFPTLVVQFEPKMFDQTWEALLVLDYTVALPPLSPAAGFIPIRVAAYTGHTPTKYFYFGTEMNENVPRVPPEMENVISPQGAYQEFLLDEATCPVGYTAILSTTPRVYGNGAQDYYAPPIKVEVYDAGPGPQLIADLFPEMVGNLPAVPGSFLVEPGRGFWQGARFVGVRRIAILRQGKVVGVLRRGGRIERDQPPPEVHKRDPKEDIRDRTVAIDFGTRTTTVAWRGPKGPHQLLRIGSTDAPVIQSDFENPSELFMSNVARTLKAWRERVIFPMVRWDDCCAGVAARRARLTDAAATAKVAEGAEAPVSEIGKRNMASIVELPSLRDYLDQKVPYLLFGLDDGESSEKLKKPAPPVVDEEGIGAHDPFDPVELYAYHCGLVVNHRMNGVHTRYKLTMPTGWTAKRRQEALIAFRRGLFRSLPAGMLEYHNLEALTVEDAGDTAIPLAVTSFRAFSIQPKDGPVNFGVFEAGASGAGVLFGTLREAKESERGRYDRVAEYLEPQRMHWFGGERLLHRLAHKVFVANMDKMRQEGIVFEPALDEDVISDGELIHPCPQSRANRLILMDLVRPLLEGDATAKLATQAKLLSQDGRLVDLELSVSRVRLKMALDGWFTDAAKEFADALSGALVRIARGSDPYEGLRIILGGRVSMNPKLQEAIQKALPSHVRVHRYREPDKTNLHAPTVKTACVLGVLSLTYDRTGVVLRTEKRDAFRYRVGRARHGQLMDTLDPSVEYDEWREMGPCNKTEVEVRFMTAEDDGEVAADDPRVMRSVFPVEEGAIGYRIFLRAVNATTVEVGIGTQGEEPDGSFPSWKIDLTTGVASPAVAS